MKILGVIFAIVAAGLGLSWMLGSKAQEGLENYAAGISETPAYMAEVTSFDHGLTHSVAHMIIKPDLEMLTADMDPEQREMLLTVLNGMEEGIAYIIDIYQGPIILKDGIYPGLYKAVVSLDPESAFIRQNIPGDVNVNDYLDVNFLMGFLGKGELNVDIEGFSQTYENTRFTFGGFNSNTRLGSYGRTFDLTGTISPFSLVSQTENLEVSGIEIEGSGSAGGVLNDVEMHVRIPSITGDGIRQTTMNNLAVDLVVDVNDDGTFSAEYALSTGSIINTSLPEPVNHIRAVFGGHNLSVDGFTSFYQNYTQAASSQDPYAAQMAMTDSLSLLFQGNPVFEIKEISYSQGQNTTLDLKADLSFSENIFANPAVMQGNPLMALGAVNLNLDMQFSQAFLDLALETYINDQFNGIQGMDPAFLEQMRQQQLAQTGAMVQQLVTAGYLVQQGSGYEVKANIADGALQLNGTPMPLPF